MIWFLAELNYTRGGERRGLVVSKEDCQSKGRGIESQSFSFFYSDAHQLVSLVNIRGSEAANGKT